MFLIWNILSLNFSTPWATMWRPPFWMFWRQTTHSLPPSFHPPLLPPPKIGRWISTISAQTDAIFAERTAKTADIGWWKKAEVEWLMDEFAFTDRLPPPPQRHPRNCSICICPHGFGNFDCSSRAPPSNGAPPNCGATLEVVVFKGKCQSDTGSDPVAFWSYQNQKAAEGELQSLAGEVSAPVENGMAERHAQCWWHIRVGGHRCGAKMATKWSAKNRKIWKNSINEKN